MLPSIGQRIDAAWAQHVEDTDCLKALCTNCTLCGGAMECNCVAHCDCCKQEWTRQLLNDSNRFEALCELKWRPEVLRNITYTIREDGKGAFWLEQSTTTIKRMNIRPAPGGGAPVRFHDVVAKE